MTSGTLQNILGTVNVNIAGGTLSGANPSGGTIDYIPVIGQIGTMPAISVGNASGGTIDVLSRLGTMPNAVVASGTLQMLNAGTLTTLGTITNPVTVTWGLGTANP